MFAPSWDQDPRAEVLGLDRLEALVEGDHDQLGDPQPLDHVALDLERHDQLRRGLRVDDAERMRLEGEHGVGALDHRTMADVDAVEGPDRDPGGRGSASGSIVTWMLIGRELCQARQPPGGRVLEVRSPIRASSTLNGPIAVRRSSRQ